MAELTMDDIISKMAENSAELQELKKRISSQE